MNSTSIHCGLCDRDYKIEYYGKHCEKPRHRANMEGWDFCNLCLTYVADLSFHERGQKHQLIKIRSDFEESSGFELKRVAFMKNQPEYEAKRLKRAEKRVEKLKPIEAMNIDDILRANTNLIDGMRFKGNALQYAWNFSPPTTDIEPA